MAAGFTRLASQHRSDRSDSSQPVQSLQATEDPGLRRVRASAWFRARRFASFRAECGGTEFFREMARRETLGPHRGLAAPAAGRVEHAPLLGRLRLIFAPEPRPPTLVALPCVGIGLCDLVHRTTGAETDNGGSAASRVWQ